MPGVPISNTWKIVSPICSITLSIASIFASTKRFFWLALANFFSTRFFDLSKQKMNFFLLFHQAEIGCKLLYSCDIHQI